MLSLTFVVIGIVLEIWRKPIASWIYKVQRPWFKALFSWFINVDAPWFRNSYDFAGAGILLMIMAYAAYFGPITL